MARQHPGRTLLTQYMKPQKLSQNRLARKIFVPPRRINEIILGKRAISADTAVRLGHYFGNSASYWLHLQAEYDIERARENIGSQLYAIQEPTLNHPHGSFENKVKSVDEKTKPAIRQRLMR